MSILRSKDRTQGFTLIELLVVVAIIAILAFVVITNLNSARQKARDAKITQDMSEVDKALALVNANSQVTSSFNGTDTSAGTKFNSIITILQGSTYNYIPANASVAHPLSTATPARNYEYAGLVTGVSLSYRLCAQLEKPSDATKPWQIDENGSVYTSATDLCGAQPAAQ